MLADESGEAWDDRRFRQSEAVAKIIPEADGLLGACFISPRKVATIAACIRTGSGGDFAARHLAANIVFRAVGVQRDLRALQHHEQFVFLCTKPRQEPVEGDEARLAGKDGVEPLMYLALQLHLSDLSELDT